MLQEEGIAYRGRILVDLSTNMGQAPEDQEPITPLEQDEVDRIMVSLFVHIAIRCTHHWSVIRRASASFFGFSIKKIWNPAKIILFKSTPLVQMNLGRHKYHLFASFFQGNMISEKENQVEFEVSIGDYGNKFSPQADPAPSTTQPCNPGNLAA